MLAFQKLSKGVALSSCFIKQLCYSNKFYFFDFVPVAITGSQRLDSARRLSATNGNIKNTASKKQLSTKSENKQTHNDLNVDKGNNGIVRPEQDDTRNTDSITRIDVGEQSGYNGGNSCEPGDKQVKTSDSLPLAISDEHIRRGSKNDGESIKISNSWDMSPEDDLKVNFSSKDNVKYKSEKNDRSNVRNEELLIENIEENTHLTEKDQIDRTVIQESNTHIQHKNARKTEFEQTDETSLEQNEERPVEQMDRRSSEQTVIKTQAQDLVQNVLNMAVLQLSKN